MWVPPIFQDLKVSEVHVTRKKVTLEALHTFDLRGPWGPAVLWAYCQEHGISFPAVTMEYSGIGVL